MGALRRGWSKSDPLQDLLEEISHMAAEYDFVLEPRWISSKENVLADALSRHRFDVFWAAVAELDVAAALQACCSDSPQGC
jgi:hypothetical protein